MSDPFYGEIRMFGGTFAPQGWANCDGSLLPISENEALFQLLGTTYGGDGQETFAVPDLRGRVPIHQGNGHVPGEQGGQESVTVTTAQMPGHTHPIAATTAIADTSAPANNILAESTLLKEFIDQGESSDVTLNPGAVKTAGGGQAHENRQPYLAVRYIISLSGIFPPQS